MAGQRDETRLHQYAVTNITAYRSLNCNEEAGALLCADVLGTLIKDLIEKGIISGSVA